MADLSGLMDHSTMACTKMASVMAREHSSGPTAVIMLVIGATTKCTEPASSDGPTVACTLATTKMIRSMVRAFIRGLTGAGTKAYSTRAASTERASIGNRMVKRSTAFGTWVRKYRCLTTNKTS